MRLFELHQEDDAVSPVIGVILMVAITVILAAVIGTFVLGMGEDINRNAQAGVSFSTSGNNVAVQLTSQGNVDDPANIEINPSGSCTLASDETDSHFGDGVGEIIDVESCDTGDKITVLATIDGNQNVVATYEYNG